MLSKADCLLYGGAAGGGKSFVASITSIYFAYNQPNLQVYIFRKTCPAIDATFLSGSASFQILLEPLIKSGHVKINYSKRQIAFSNGSMIHLSHCATKKDLDKYQGSAIGLLIIDEAGQFEESIYTYLKSRLRIAHEIRPEFKDVLPKVLLTSNPDGVGLSWLKRTFVNFCPDDKIKKYKSEFTESRQFIRSKLSDNPHLRDTDYAEQLKGMGSPELVAAYLNGDWNVSLNSFFGNSFTNDNIRDPFQIPIGWKKYRMFDWGYSSPFSVLWMAESDGTLASHKGKQINSRRGDIFIWAEYYGDDNGTEKGLKLTAEQIANKTMAFEELMRGSLYAGAIQAGAADTSIWNAESNGVSIEATMRKHKCTFVQANKAPGSRVLGWQKIIEMFTMAKNPMRESGGLFIFNNCHRLIGHIREAPRDDKKLEDIDTNSHDHDLDCLRYGVMMKKKSFKARQF